MVFDYIVVLVVWNGRRKNGLQLVSVISGRIEDDIAFYYD